MAGSALLVVAGGLGLWQRQRASSQRDLTPYTRALAKRGNLAPGVVHRTGELEKAVRSVMSVPSVGGCAWKSFYVVEGQAVRKAGHCLMDKAATFRRARTELKAQVRQG